MSGDQVNGAVYDQATGGFVDLANQLRQAAEAEASAAQAGAFARAMEEMGRIKTFLGDPSHILGSPLTKHGEIAEVLEVRVRNAIELVVGQPEVATFEGIGRTAAADFRMDGIDVQAKWINGLNGAMKHVLDHIHKYPDFGAGGANYVVPKDQYEVLIRIYHGECVDGLSSKTVNAIREKLAEIESATGRGFESLVHPGISTYADAQQGRVFEFVEGKNDDLGATNKERQEAIAEEHAPSLIGAVEAVAVAALVSGVITFSIRLYSKHKQGKNAFKGDFKADDWKEVLKDTGIGALEGGLTGGALYCLTNFAGMSAPYASALVTAAKGVAVLANDLHNKKIDSDQFISLGLIVCAESAIVGIAAAAGQTLIPIPVLGGIIGSISGRMLVRLAKNVSDDVAKRIRGEMQTYLAGLDERSAQALKEIDDAFDAMGDLVFAAFDVKNNARLLGLSVTLAQITGVPEELIIHSADELDHFMLA